MHRVVLNFRCLVRFLSYQVKHSRLHEDMIQSAASKTVTRAWVHRFTEVSRKQGQQQTNFGIIFLPQSGWIIVQKSILQRLRPKVLVAHVQASTPFVEGSRNQEVCQRTVRLEASFAWCASSSNSSTKSCKTPSCDHNRWRRSPGEEGTKLSECKILSELVTWCRRHEASL